MSVKIRLTRTGAKHRPFYRIVVTDSRMPRDGRFIATLGTYDPLTASGNIEVDGELVNEWIKKGARPSVAVKQLLKRAGMATVEVSATTSPEKPSGAVSLDDLRGPEGEEPKETVEETASVEEVHAAPEAKKAQAKPRKPARKGTSKKEKSKSKTKSK